MLSKAGHGAKARLICSDCGFELSSDTAQKGGSSRRSQLITALMIALFGSTAGVLMTLKDQRSPTLLDDATMDLGERRNNQERMQRFNSVLPRSTSIRR